MLSSVPLLPHNLPPMEDTGFAALFLNGFHCLALTKYPCRVPKKVDRQVIATISLSLQHCPPNQTCKGYRDKRFYASMKNQSFIRLSTKPSNPCSWTQFLRCWKGIREFRFFQGFKLLQSGGSSRKEHSGISNRMVGNNLNADNPGVWFIHCHLEEHTTWGLAMGFIVEKGPKPSQCVLPPPRDLPAC
ncbi:unnamed protein product [Fraxinus pennsylvanica]|uniref:Plastocyanin-like domain-containing protein n=1 Tax=Fraxinus pennsylvanica TaxID=56036 RepID=A0AAD2EGJ4_9LAMI|nr:unnamed protein product [Fraxinus pennsylvanica]